MVSLLLAMPFSMGRVSAAQDPADPVSPPIPVHVLPKHEEGWRDCATVTFDLLREFVPETIPLSKYGGRTDRREKATGFFYAPGLRPSPSYLLLHL
jgi:hypothetical protein